MAPKHLILRCYGQRKDGKWFGVCLELNIAAEADSLPELKKKINSMISSYIEAVCETDDKASIPDLLRRRAPLSDWIHYYSIRAFCSIANLPDKMTFDEIMPFKLAHGC
jgi:hypothetical protein